MTIQTTPNLPLDLNLDELEPVDNTLIDIDFDDYAIAPTGDLLDIDFDVFELQPIVEIEI